MRRRTKRQLYADSAARFFVGSICLVVLSLTVTLATRTFRCTLFSSVSVQSSTTQAVRQHLDQDAFQWTPPAQDFSVLEAPAFYPRLTPVGIPVAPTLFHKSLYNRPPPSC